MSNAEMNRLLIDIKVRRLKRRQLLRKLRYRELLLKSALTGSNKKDKMGTEKINTDTDEKKDWIAVGSNKQPVPLKKGQTKKEAVEAFVEEKEAERKAEKKGKKMKTPTVDLKVKPTVSDKKLQKTIKELYKGQNQKERIGDGTMMCAIREELRSGEPTKNRFHSIKGKNTITELDNHIGSGRLNTNEKAIARALRDDLKKALSGN